MKLFKLAVLITAVSTLIFSCTKDEIQNNPIDQNLKKSIDIQLNSEVKKVRNACDGEGILSFKDEDAYLSTMKQLKELTLSHSKAIKEQIGRVSAEEYVKIYEEKGLNNMQVLFDFSKKMGINSLFTDLYYKEAAWLENGGTDINEDPDNHFVSDVYERVLFNANSEVIVGDKIYKKLSNGHLIISDLNFDRLCSLRNNADLLRLPKGVEFVGDLTDRSGKRMANCDGSKRNADYVTPNQDFRIKWVLEINTPLFGSRNIRAATHNYYCKKYRNNGNCRNWNRTNAFATATVGGDISGTTIDADGELVAECDVRLDVGSQTTNGVDKCIESKMFVQTRTRSTWISGSHSGINNISYNSNLTW